MRETRLVRVVARIEVAVNVESTSTHAESGGAQVGGNRSRVRQDLIQAANDLPMSMDVPEVLERDHELECELDIRVGRVIDGGPHVLSFCEDERQPESLVVVLRQVGRTRDLEHALRVSAERHVGVVRFLELGACERADRLEHPEPLLIEAARSSAHKALVEE